MQFDVFSFAIFLAFFLPGLLAQKARDSIAPRSLKPHSAIMDAGEFVLAGVVVHAFLIIAIYVFSLFFARGYFAVMKSTLRCGHFYSLFWGSPRFVCAYFVVSLGVGYFVGGVQGWLILRQPVRNWVLSNATLSRLMLKLKVFGFLQEQPVWYFVFQQKEPRTQVFVEVEMSNNGGFYTGELQSYGIVDDSEENKDFYIVDVHYKAARPDDYVRLSCEGVLLNAKNVASLQVFKTIATMGSVQQAPSAAPEPPAV